MNEYERDEQQKQREEERKELMSIAAGLVQCRLCGGSSNPDELVQCEICGVQAHRGCMDHVPAWLTDLDEYTCGPTCELKNLEAYLKMHKYIDQETIDHIGRRLEELREALLPDGIAMTLLHLHALRETLTEEGRPAAAQIATEAIAMIRRLAHLGRAERKAV